MKNIAWRIGALSVSLGLLATEAPAQVFQPFGAAGNVDVNYVTGKIVDERRVFAVKILCGRVRPAAPGDFPLPPELLTPGFYLSAVNIHNPHNVSVTFAKKAVVTLPERSPLPGTVSRIRKEVLGPDQGMEVDCQDVFGLLTPPPAMFGATTPLIKGFVVLEISADFQLDVVAVNTFKNLEGAVTVPGGAVPVCSAGTVGCPPIRSP